MGRYNCEFVGKTSDKVGVSKDGVLGVTEGEMALVTERMVEVSVIPSASAMTPWMRGAESESGSWLSGDSG